jgi:hypothetical protein
MNESSLSQTSKTHLLYGRCRDNTDASCTPDKRKWRLHVGDKSRDEGDEDVCAAHIMATFTRDGPDETGRSPPFGEYRFALSGHRIIPPSASDSQSLQMTDSSYRVPSTIPIQLCIDDKQPGSIDSVYILQNARELKEDEFDPSLLPSGHTRLFQVGTTWSAVMRAPPFAEPPSSEASSSHPSRGTATLVKVPKK